MTPLKRLRIDAGLTGKELAAATGVSAATISDIENGGGAGPAKLRVLADFLSERLERQVMASDLLVVEEPAA